VLWARWGEVAAEIRSPRLGRTAWLLTGFGSGLPCDDAVVAVMRKDAAVMKVSSTVAVAAAVSLFAAFMVSSTTLVAVFCVFSLLCLAAWFILERRGD
jgi:hypothetical protein